MLTDSQLQQRLAQLQADQVAARRAWAQDRENGHTINCESAIKCDILSALIGELRWVLGQADQRY